MHGIRSVRVRCCILMTFDQAVEFHVDHVRITPAAAQTAVVHCTMFPCTGVMSWLGAQGILDLRRELEAKRGPAFSLKRFHDELLGYGSIPVPLIAEMMTDEASGADPSTRFARSG